MSKLVVVTAQGYTKEEALAKTTLTAEVKGDATLAFKNAGRPEGEELNAFATKYLDTKVKGAEGIAYSITVVPGAPDTRTRPYEVTSIVTKGTREFETFYQGLIGVNDDGSGGTEVFKADSKGEAQKLGTAYVTEHKVKVNVKIVKVPVKQADALIIDYVPSPKTTLGTYTFFVNEKEA